MAEGARGGGEGYDGQFAELRREADDHGDIGAVFGAGVAIADGRYEITGMANGTSRKMWASLTLTRGAGGWRIAAIRNMLPDGRASRAGG